MVATSQISNNMMRLTERLKNLRHVVLDMDGTIYLGNQLFDATLPFIETLNEQSIGYTFITNNNSRSRSEYVTHLESLGVLANSDQLFTSAHATLEYMSAHMPELKQVFVLGTSGLVEDLEHGGLTVTEQRPDAVIVGFDLTLNYDRLAQAAYWINQGVPYLATHPRPDLPHQFANRVARLRSNLRTARSGNGAAP